MTDTVKFPSSFNSYVYIGDSIETQHGAFTIRAEIHHDWHTGAPWEECDGHGPVSDWTSRAKRPGELILSTDRSHKRFYDYQAACRIARRDGWNSKPYDTIETPRQRAARAAMSDFEALRAWCNDEWFWSGIVVTVTHTDTDTELASESLWGIDANHPNGDNSYLTECAESLATEALGEARNRARTLASALLEGVE